jgi:glyoxylase-like metal-dependent hydrolase (beta-lactamase superfamily II)
MLNITKVVGGSIFANCYIIEENNHVILIDFVPEVEKIIRDKKYFIHKILLTHIHFDHLERLSEFQKNYSFGLGLSRKGYDFLKNPDKKLLLIFPPFVLENYKNLNLDNAEILNDYDVIDFYDHKIEVFESPGHSPDSLMFILRELKTVFTGDTIFEGSIGRTDLPGGDYNTQMTSIKKILALIDEDYKLLPGHGDETTVINEKNYNYFLKDLKT